MVSKRSFISVFGAVLMLVAMAPMALSQSAPEAPAASAPPTEDVMVSIPQQELEAIRSQLAALALRVDELELLVSAAPELDGTESGVAEDAIVDTVDVVEGPVAIRPNAPRAKGDTSLRYADNDPDPKRGLVAWKDRASNEDGHRLYAKRVYCDLAPGANPDQALDYDDFTEVRSEFVRVGKVGADVTEFRPVHQQVRSKLPPIPGQRYGSGEIYELFVSAFNEAGESRKVMLGSYMITPEFMCP